MLLQNIAAASAILTVMLLIFKQSVADMAIRTSFSPARYSQALRNARFGFILLKNSLFYRDQKCQRRQRIIFSDK